MDGVRPGSDQSDPNGTCMVQCQEATRRIMNEKGDKTMKAIEFNSRVENGAISIPTEFGLVDGRVIRVLILINEPDGDLTADAKDTAFCAKTDSSWQSQADVLNSTAGSWAGELLRDKPWSY